MLGVCVYLQTIVGNILGFALARCNKEGVDHPCYDSSLVHDNSYTSSSVNNETQVMINLSDVKSGAYLIKTQTSFTKVYKQK